MECTVTVIECLNQIFERNKNCLREIDLCHIKGIELVIGLKWDLLEALCKFHISRSALSASFFVSLIRILPKSINLLALCAISMQDSSENILILPPNIREFWLFECHFGAMNDMVAQSISKLEELTVFHDWFSRIFILPAYQPNPKLKHFGCLFR